MKKPWKTERDKNEEDEGEEDDEFVKDFKMGSERGDFHKRPRHQHHGYVMPRGRIRPDKFRHGRELALHDLDDEEQGYTDDELDPRKIERVNIIIKITFLNKKIRNNIKNKVNLEGNWENHN